MIEASKVGLNMIEPSTCKRWRAEGSEQWELIGFNFSMLHFSFHPSIPRFPRSKYLNVDRITTNDYVGIRITRQFLGYGIWDGSLSLSLSQACCSPKLSRSICKLNCPTSPGVARGWIVAHHFIHHTNKKKTLILVTHRIHVWYIC